MRLNLYVDISKWLLKKAQINHLLNKLKFKFTCNSYILLCVGTYVIGNSSNVLDSFKPCDFIDFIGFVNFYQASMPPPE